MRSVTVSSGRGSMPRARSRRRRPTLPGRSRLRSASVSAASCADRLQAGGPQPRLRARADPRQAAHVERREERRLASGRDDRQPAGLAAVARDLGDDLRGRDADRGAQARRAPDGGLHRLGDRARLAERLARPRPGRGSPRRAPCARRSARPRGPRSRPRPSTRGRRCAAAGRRSRAGTGAAPRRTTSPSRSRTCAPRSSRSRRRRARADLRRRSAASSAARGSPAPPRRRRTRPDRGARGSRAKTTDRARPRNSLLLRAQALDDPALAVAAVADPVVQAVLAVLPELVASPGGADSRPSAAGGRAPPDGRRRTRRSAARAPRATRSARSVSRPRRRSGSRAASSPSRCPIRRARGARRSLRPAL